MQSRLSYESNIDDMLAFQRHHFVTSPEVKKRVNLLRAAFVVGFTMIAVGTGMGRHGTAYFLWSYLTVAAFFAVGTPWLLQQSGLRQMKRQCQSKSVKERLGPSCLRVTDDGLVSQNRLTESKTRWQGIENVVSSPTHTFIYLTPRVAHVIPHDKITEGDLREFLRDVEQHRAFADRLPLSG